MIQQRESVTESPMILKWKICFTVVKTDKNLPIGVILTIAAAGSEMSSSMVLTIEDGMMKRSYGHDCSRPRFCHYT